MPTQAIDKLTDQHQIRNRQEFEEAVSCVFEEEIANKSLGRKSRLNMDIVLDNHAFKSSAKSRSNIRKQEEILVFILVEKSIWLLESYKIC